MHKTECTYVLLVHFNLGEEVLGAVLERFYHFFFVVVLCCTTREAQNYFFLISIWDALVYKFIVNVDNGLVQGFWLLFLLCGEENRLE
jgi:hypothetical protein